MCCLCFAGGAGTGCWVVSADLRLLGGLGAIL